MIHWWFLISWQTFVVVLGSNLHPHCVLTSASRYSYLHIDGPTYRCIQRDLLYISLFHFYSHIQRDIFTYSASNKPELSEIYLIKITCHRIIIISLLVAANDAQPTKCYHGMTIMFNPKTLRLIVDLARVCWKFRWPLPNPFARFHWSNFWTHGTWSPWLPFCFPYIT